MKKTIKLFYLIILFVLIFLAASVVSKEEVKIQMRLYNHVN